MERLHRLEQQMQEQRDQSQASTAEILRAAAASEQQMGSLAAQVQQLTVALNQLTVAARPSRVEADPGPSTRVAAAALPEPTGGVPERYGGDPEGCNPFIVNCSILFALQPQTFASERAKVAFTINLLTERARLWGTAEWERQTPACASFNAFTAELRKVFGPVSRGPDAAGGLLGLRQGTRRVVDYALEFRIRARESDWNSGAQIDAFLVGLAEYLKDELVSYELPSSLDRIIELVTRLDQRIQARRQEKRRSFSGHQRAWRRDRLPEVEEPEPMQVGEARRRAAEQQRRRRQDVCLYCGKAGHFIVDCPVKGLTHQ